jgi:hypothetical protein
VERCDPRPLQHRRPPLTINKIHDVDLTAGGLYWILVTPDVNTFATWEDNTIGASGFEAQSGGLDGRGPLQVNGPATLGAFDVLGHNLGHNIETPLPAALQLFATGLGALGLLGWRRKRKAAALAA